MEHVHEHAELIADRFTLRPYFRTDSFEELWKLAQEFPANHFDDASPKTLASFQKEMVRRLRCGEGVWRVTDADGHFAGAIGFAPYNELACMFHGITFRQDLHGTGVCAAIVRRFLADRMTDNRCARLPVYACYYSHNRRIARFLKKLGFEPAWDLNEHATQNGVPVRIKLVYCSFVKSEHTSGYATADALPETPPRG